MHTPGDGGAFGVGDASKYLSILYSLEIADLYQVGALDDPFLQDFLQHPYGNWNQESYDPVSGIPSGQFQFDWENANLFGTNGTSN